MKSAANLFNNYRHLLQKSVIYRNKQTRNMLNIAKSDRDSKPASATATAGRDPSSNPKVTRLRQLVHPNSPDGWEKCWEEGVTPWDLGQPTPLILNLVRSGTLPKGRILVPGCGNGYDVVAIASTDRYALGLDISSTAIKKAKEWSSTSPNASNFDFLAADFFTWQPKETFDMVFDYTFFSALEPSLRSSWAKKIANILKPDGELITLIYLHNDQASGPPYNNSVADYEEVLIPEGFRAVSIVDNELAIKPRMGKEKLARWKRCPHSSL